MNEHEYFLLKQDVLDYIRESGRPNNDQAEGSNSSNWKEMTGSSMHKQPKAVGTSLASWRKIAGGPNVEQSKAGNNSRK